MSHGLPVTMWEARAVDGRLEELLDWVRARIGPDAQLYRSAGEQARLVVIDPTGQAAELLADPPPDLVSRPPHAWDFEAVRNV